MANQLVGKVALVTGAGQGIGRAIAARFLDEGATVAIVESNSAIGKDAHDELAERGKVAVEIADVSDEAQVAAVVDRVVSWVGRLDVVVNNAGLSIEPRAPLSELDLAQWRRMLDVDLTGPLIVSRAAARHLRRQNGSIINIASTRAMMSEPNTFAYSAAKGGLVALTHALAISLGPDIRANAIAPGWIATETWLPRGKRHPSTITAADHAQHPAGRVGRPEDIAAIAAFLASDDATFITGTVITADGGMTRKMIYAE